MLPYVTCKSDLKITFQFDVEAGYELLNKLTKPN